MPQLIRTPDQIFRAEPGITLYYIEFLFAGKQSDLNGLNVAFDADVDPGAAIIDSDSPPGRSELIAWFSSNLPHICVEPLAPSEGCGIIVGGVYGRLRIGFDDAALATFTQSWEKSDGDSTDPRWQCYVIPYANWLAKRYPRTAGLVEHQPTLTTVRGESVRMFAFTPLTPEETRLPCSLGLYWDLDQQGLTARVLLYRGDDFKHHVSMDIAAPHDTVGDIGLSLAELAQCRAALAQRQQWLRDRFDCNSEFADDTVAIFQSPPESDALAD